MAVADIDGDTRLDLVCVSRDVINGEGTLLWFRQTASRSYLRQPGTGLNAEPVAVDIAGDLVERPVLNVATSATRYDVSFVAANNAVAKLVDVGLLVEITGRGHDRVFRCDRVLQILER